ncbi:MAG TPA: GlsB/YeaQ/YmgE family stress response membrane protein [Opitutaceae bacterium]
MDFQQVVLLLVLGGVAGWLAGQIMKGGGFGILGNVIIGVLGGVIGGALFEALGITIGGNRWVGPLVTATVGAVVLLFLIGLVRRT